MLMCFWYVRCATTISALPEIEGSRKALSAAVSSKKLPNSLTRVFKAFCTSVTARVVVNPGRLAVAIGNVTLNSCVPAALLAANTRELLV